MNTLMINPVLKLRRVTLLGLTTALVGASTPGLLMAQSCAVPGGSLGAACEHANAGSSVAVPTQPNTEFETIPQLSSDGFEISVDGAPVASDGTVVNTPSAKSRVSAAKRRQDVGLAANNIAVKFDGLDVQPRLNVETLGANAPLRAGETVVFRNDMNYPAFVARGELRILDQSARGGAKTVAVLAMDPNTERSSTMPSGDGLVYVYRVYDARGRYDETAPASLVAPSRRGAVDGVEEGIDATAKRNIPVFGGAVTVSGTDVSGPVRTMGETVRPDGDGDFVLQRILPTGEHRVNVDIAGGPSLARDVEVAAHDLFYIGLIDVTLGKRIQNDLLDATGEPYDDITAEGRVAFYLKGKIKGDYLLTAAADTGHDDLGDLLRNFDEKNPQSLLDRIDPDEYYPVYGDDSTSEITAPTSGKLYIKIEKNASHLLWGNFKSEIRGTEYLRNERTLYGAQGVFRSSEQTGNGDARIEAQIYAAQPDTLPQRDVFLGTGGSSYFLKFQDITRGSETIQVEVQNPTTGQIIERKTLTYGVDYDINYIQGLIILKRPLSGSAADSGLIVTNPNGDNRAYLVVNYEHTPTASDVDAFSYGGRVQAWANDNWRVGVTGMNEDLGTSEQKSYGADILYRHSERTFFELEIARTDGTGKSEDRSLDGGLTLSTNTGATGEGQALRFKGQVDLREAGAGFDGLVGGYFEDREAGFSTLNYRSLNDETLWGVYAELEPTDQVSLRFYHDDYDDSAGKLVRETGAEVSWVQSSALTWEAGVERVEKVTPGSAAKTGERTDVALRLTYEPNDRAASYAFAQGTVSRSGGLSRNNRFGIGGRYQLGENWRLEGEVSDGSTGVGARVLVGYERDENVSSYFGWTLDPDREFGGRALNGRDRGQFVANARRKLNDRLTMYAENTYDLFGEHRSLTSVYGADYAFSETLSFTGGLEVGQVSDDGNNTDFDRTALSLGSSYRDEVWAVTGRVEYRRDEGLQAGDNRDADTIAAKVTARYKISENARLLMAAEAVQSDNAAASIPDAEYVEANLGYAYRPVDNDRLNVLARYTYLYDMTERVAASPASGASFELTPRQRAHVLSVDASYDANESWTLGGKIGGRWSDQDNGAGFVSNNAVLGVVNARYHVVHNWDALVEYRVLNAEDIGSDTGLTASLYRHVGNTAKVGIGYNFGKFSDDLTDVTYNDRGAFLNFVAKF